MVPSITQESPVDTLCRKLGKSMLDLATAAEVSYTQLYHCSRGNVALPKKLLRFVEEFGFDAEALAKQQEEWRRRKRAEMAADIRQIQEAIHV